jgi:hypothetical protein
MNWFEVYYAYIDWCERDNWANMRDPNHDCMEWNHTLPQSLFGNLPFGQWLTVEQHAVASALQTLMFRRSCLHGRMLPLLPAYLKEMCMPYYWEMTGVKDSKKQRERALKGCKKGALVVAEKYGSGTFGRTREQHSADSRRAGAIGGKISCKVMNTERWQCTVTGYITTAGPLTRYQKTKGIDPTNRRKL